MLSFFIKIKFIYIVFVLWYNIIVTLHSAIDSVEKTGFVCGPTTMTKTIWDVDDLDSEVISVYGIISDPDETWLPDDVEALYNFDAMLEEIKARIIVR